jgi:CBS domain containing-hemolysin-like protein
LEQSALRNIIELVLVVGLILLNGYFVAAEYAIVNVRRTRLEQLVSEGNSAARAALRGKNQIDSVVAASQLGITMASLGVGWLGEPALASLLDPVFEGFLPHEAAFVTGHAVATVISFIGITFLHVILGEQIPKIASLNNAETIALTFTRPMLLFAAIFRPVIRLANAITGASLRLLGMSPGGGHELVHSVEELRMIVEQSSEAGFLDQEENQIAQRALGLGDLSARDVMVPRTEMSTVPTTVTHSELLQRIVDEGHSRFPVYQGSIDNVVGIVHVKDLVKYQLEGGQPGDLNVRRIMREPLFVPETLPANELLGTMRRLKRHVAIAVDEYGGTAGLVTLEDIVERLVGSVQDEFEAPELHIQRQPDGSYLVNGLVNLSELSEALGLEIESEDYSTIGGYVFGLLGRRPQVGDLVQDPQTGLTAQVEALDGLRIALLKVVAPPRRAEDADDAAG